VYKKLKVPIKWKCHNLNQIVTTSNDAVFNSKYGWICECGFWVTDSSSEDKDKHSIISRDFRFAYFEDEGEIVP